MRKFALTTLLLGALTGGFAASAVADDCCYPCPTSCCDWSFADGKFRVGADYLYWNTKADGLFLGDRITTGTASVKSPTSVDIGSSSSSASVDSTNITVPAEFVDPIDPNFQYDSGFRVWLGYELPCDMWELGVCYTYMPTSMKRSTAVIDPAAPVSFANAIVSPLAEFVTVGTGVPATASLYGAVASKWNSTFQYLDVDVARTVRFGECFKLRPHIGFRAAWGDQKLHQVFTDRLVATIGEPGTTFVSVKEKFQGYGIEGGLWADYNVGYGISLVGHVGGSILYSRFRNNAEVRYFNTTLEAPAVTSAVLSSSTTYAAIPSLDYFAGIMYADNFCDFDFNVHLGWEQHVWFDLSRLVSRGNYSTQGLTVGLEVGF